eukprot:CAMPEP_0196726522 /NCGR_PEP_ID=MMETSP1091-20130531/7781_1 /TAXON_ID=302021 /ORGANISM="Rhodomonas sp., Strain CCMP768" /LENGTH=176 /DNA_ID=CAMNT_0042068975 /DNA_START=19 /DNA_END=549 /DNA_ORIENTATION=-
MTRMLRVLFFVALANAHPHDFACSRSMAVGEVKPMDAPNLIEEGTDRTIDTVGDVACGGTLQTNTKYTVVFTLPADGYNWLIEAKGVGATFDTPFSNCADRQEGDSASTASKVTFTSTGTATLRMLSSLGNAMDETTKVSAECTFLVEEGPAAKSSTLAPTIALVAVTMLLTYVFV